VSRLAGIGSTLSTLKVVTGADPAANAEFSVTVPAGKWWELVSVSVLLAQGATQTPQPILTLDDGATVFYEGFGSSAAQAAGTTCRYTWAPDSPQTGQVGAGAGVHATAPLIANLALPPGARVRSSTLGIGANTDYGAPALYVVEYG
jgi:hypothetical protein